MSDVPANDTPPLKGRRVLITRPLPEAFATAMEVLALGGKPLLAPALMILPPADPTPLARAVARLADYRGVIVTSANGARALLAAREALPDPLPPLPPLFAVGPKTAHILERAGCAVTTPGERFDGSALAQAILAWQPQPGPLLFPRAAQGREELVAALQAAGREVELVVAYRSQPASGLPPEVEQTLMAGGIGAILFFSPRTVDSFLQLLPGGDTRLLAGMALVAGSDAIAAPLLARGLRGSTHIAPNPTSAALLQTLAAVWAEA